MKLRSLFFSLVFIVIVLAAVLSMLPIAHPLIDLASNFHFHFAWALIVVAILSWGLSFKGSALMTFLLALGCFFFYLSPSYIKSEKANATKVYSLWTANIRGGNTKNETIQILIKQILKHKPDILFLQEISKNQWAHLNNHPEINKIWKHRNYCSAPLCRTGILSSLIGSTPKKTKQKWLPMSEMSIDVNGKIVNLINIHAARPHHVYITQKFQFSELAKRIKNLHQPVLLAGDFNAVLASHPIRRFVKNSDLAAFGAVKKTWPTAVPYFLKAFRLGLDQAFVSKGDFKLISKQLGPDLGSDHLPVMFQFQINQLNN